VTCWAGFQVRKSVVCVKHPSFLLLTCKEKCKNQIEGRNDMQSTILTHPPLKVCLAVLRFSPVEAMGTKYIPLIQDNLRKSGLPFFVKQANLPFTANAPFPGQQIEEQWLFYSADNQEMVVLTKSSFAYQAFTYVSFSAFQTRFLELFDLVSGIAELYPACVFDFFGLRYSNAIEGHEWHRYLTDSYAGILLPKDILDPSYIPMKSSFVQGVTNLGPQLLGNISVKLLQNNEGLVYPPDIALIGNQPSRPSQLVTLLDIDHFVVYRNCKMKREVLSDVSSKLHDSIESVFFSALSEHAIKEWSQP